MMKYFFAYPANPPEIGKIIELAIKEANLPSDRVLSWKAMDVIGNFIPTSIFEQVNDKIFIADISHLNCNVTYEIGYAIGQQKSILLVKNSSISEATPTILDVGIFDTLGYAEYSNSMELAKIIRTATPNVPYSEAITPDITSPVYLLDTKYKTDFSTRIAARIKKARLTYRSFDPGETPRLSAYEAIEQVAMSHGIVLSFLGKEYKNHEVHNLRASFIGGLSFGMSKIRLFLQNGNGPVPVDYRDFTKSCYNIDDINKHIAEFTSYVVDSLQQIFSKSKKQPKSFLENLNLGSSAAENEMRTLQNYYLKTDPYFKALRGEAQLVIGRKGSGKSAIFLQIRDKERASGKNIVLDLKPEGYKLIKFKEQVLSFLEEGTFQHTIMAFWEYVLLLEICHKILEVDKSKHFTNGDLYKPYNELRKIYQSEEYLTEGDFSERMSLLMENLKVNYKQKYGGKDHVRLSLPEITGLLYETDIKSLKLNLIEYLKHKDHVWLLFDNVDKGWPASGLTHEDLIIIRTLIDATRRIQRYFERNRTQVFPIIFLRNDVYDLLVVESPDRQKEAKVLLDWTDPDLLRQIIKLRILSNSNLDPKLEFEAIWRTICVSHIDGEDSFQFFIDRCLMRPRFLINFINHCRSVAINLSHTMIMEEDIIKGFSSYSSDLLTDINFEIRDIFPEAGDILFGFITSAGELSLDLLKKTIESQIGHTEITEKVIDLLLWYGFIGVRHESNEPVYIHSLNYSLQLLKGLIKKVGDNVIFVVNPGFWPSLLIGSK